MNLFKTPFRRTGTVVAGAALGLIGVMSTAMPALACYPKAGDTTTCLNTDGSWVVQWDVTTTDNAFGDGKVDSVEYTPNDGRTISFTGINAEDTLSHSTHLKATQTLTGEATEATLQVNGRWNKPNGGFYVGGFQKGPVSASKPTEKCDTPEPTESASTPSSPSPEPSESTVPSSPSPSVSESTVPSSPSPSTTGSTEPSAPVSPSSTTSLPAEDTPVTEPQFIYDTTCDTLTVGIEVPVDWKESVTVTFKPSVGDSKTVTAAPGETKTVDFKASKGLKVVATPKGYEDEVATITYKAPADCDDDELALTGANSSTIAGGAALALVLGAGLFYMARRRKIRFTA
ncbi:LPXTG cell wall anchor domain-containing protein [Actinoplanes awajinensis]|uniref:Cell wall anchor protein n=1 Tax=Actinoplanes awajinensis subsp. mycoplanecinus TaxID=135947 RepID=A0A0X3V8J2_9ACTN|nr:LPXTG cell wall anchor domain-containing protein [Actinoplanes awajinensis]KUL40572.1 hypothetical protein ADL15_06160 [Actinoplanes awajinensis subsp. mycoplanecinus]